MVESKRDQFIANVAIYKSPGGGWKQNLIPDVSHVEVSRYSKLGADNQNS